MAHIAILHHIGRKVHRERLERWKNSHWLPSLVCP
jgi:metal-dependent HD superfamily phosphatase/phosphodiesterase